jgi:hypothetical protein
MDDHNAKNMGESMESQTHFGNIFPEQPRNVETMGHR